MKLILCAAALSVLFAVPAAPTVTLSPGALTFDAPVGGPAPTPQTVTLTNGSGAGAAKISWQAKTSATWLQVAPSSGSLNRGGSIDLTVSINMSGLIAQQYTGTITVFDPTSPPAYSNLTCNVTLNVLAAPKVDVTPTSVSWTVPSGTVSTPGQTVTVKNVGGQSLTWTGSSDVAWLSSFPTGGSLGPGASVPVTLNVDLTKQSSVGTVVGHWTPTSAQDPSAPSVTATLTISAVPVIGLSPQTLTVDVPQGSNPTPPTVNLSNEGTGSMGWSLTQDPAATWLVVSPTSGSVNSGLSQPLTFTITSAGLAEGTYFATIPITAGSASNSPQSVSVTLNVNASPKIGLNPTSLSFSVTQDHPTSPAAAVSITNTGFGTMTWSAKCTDSWLSASPLGGDLGSLASQPLLITATAAGLAPGAYSSIIEISGVTNPGGTPALNSPQSISIDLMVAPSDKPTNAPAGQCGLLGPELLVPALLAGALRRRAHRRTRP